MRTRSHSTARSPSDAFAGRIMSHRTVLMSKEGTPRMRRSYVTTGPWFESTLKGMWCLYWSCTAYGCCVPHAAVFLCCA